MFGEEGNVNGSCWGEEDGKTKKEVDGLREEGHGGARGDEGGSL